MTSVMTQGRTLQTLGAVAFRAGHRLAPGLTGRAAFRLFCTPPRGQPRTEAEVRLVEKLTPILDTAVAHRVSTPDADVQAYLWRTTTLPVRGRVLLLHGWTGQALVMTLFAKPLMDAGFDVVAFDLPAHGKSTGRILNMPIGARAVLAVADALGPITGLISHSFGGPIAALAVEGGSPIFRQLAVERLVLIATPHALKQVTRDFGTAFGFPNLIDFEDKDLYSRFNCADSTTVAAIS